MDCPYVRADGASTSVGDMTPGTAPGAAVGTAAGTIPGILLIGAGDTHTGIVHIGTITGIIIGGITRTGAEVPIGERLPDRGDREHPYGLTVMYGREWATTSQEYGREHPPDREQVLT